MSLSSIKFMHVATVDVSKWSVRDRVHSSVAKTVLHSLVGLWLLLPTSPTFSYSTSMNYCSIKSYWTSDSRVSVQKAGVQGGEELLLMKTEIFLDKK